MYTDAMEKQPTKGQLNKYFNLYVERPFHIVSQLQSGRYLDLVSNQVKMKTPNGFDSQLWWFDQRTKTIRNGLEKNKCLDKRHTSVYVYPSNGQWYQYFKWDGTYI